MIDSRYKDGYKLPMIASMLLLLGFLTYFIFSEFSKEKENILTEKREKVFKEAFSKLERLPNSESIRKDSNTVKWQIDSITNDLHLTYDHTDDKSKTSINVQIENQNDPNTAIIYSDFDKKTPAVQTLDSVSTLIKKVKETENLVIKDIDAEGGIGDAKIGIIKITDEDGRVSLAVTGIEVNPLYIFQRIAPQLIFSLFLIGIVGLSFWLASKSLGRERELTLLRNDLLSNMSHELKTPISTVGVALEALSNFDAADNPKLRKEYIDISRSEVKRLGLLVDKALNLSLFEQGQFVYERQDINLDEEINRILKTLQVQLNNANVKIDYAKSGNQFLVNVDKTHMVNVIHNLIENGIKYSTQPAEIEIKLIEESEQIKISVSDNGIGIPKEYHDKVFDKFFRVPHGNKHNVKGHGLGLSYVKEVIKNQGGNISLMSHEGIGSTFILKLPKTC